jgi:hypothetical protein
MLLADRGYDALDQSSRRREGRLLGLLTLAAIVVAAAITTSWND